MILDMTFGTGDLSHAIKFYDAVLGCVGIDRAPDWPDGWAGWGDGYGKGSSIWLCPPFDGKQPTAGNGTMVTFFARNASGVRDFHAAALAHGGSDEGAPGTRPYYDPTFYVAYVRDSDGNKLACAFLDYRQE
jgi:catechol 2,3-dioxygenase-like lactoylglutathione lyase family enzyme